MLIGFTFVRISSPSVLLSGSRITGNISPFTLGTLVLPGSSYTNVLFLSSTFSGNIAAEGGAI